MLFWTDAYMSRFFDAQKYKNGKCGFSSMQYGDDSVKIAFISSWKRLSIPWKQLEITHA